MKDAYENEHQRQIKCGEALEAKFKNPKISICKKQVGFKIACFDDFDCIRDFIFYICEKDGVDDAEKFFASHGITNAKIVRPVITKMVLRS